MHSGSEVRGPGPDYRLQATVSGSYTLVGMPPSSSGGVTMAETMNMLAQETTMPAFGSVAYLHLLGSAYQRAFIDRNSKIADPDFFPAPVAQLTSKSYARGLYQSIDRTHATPTPSGTLQMDDFAVQPGKPNMFALVQGEANAIQPGKRMLSAMSPTVVLDANGRVQMVAGAMRAPRVHSQALPDELRLETNGFPAATIDSLKAMGHTVGFFGGIANVNAFRRVPGGWHGVSEPRAFGAAIGY